MDKYQEIDERVQAMADKARANKGIKTDEEIKNDFFAEAIELWNETMPGDITLADGKVVTIPTI